jgi:hypothetical protein
MIPYIRNRNCRCMRCRASGLMAAAILITLGVLFLLHNYGIVRIEESIPVLLLVIGGVLLISRVGSIEGHVQPGWIQGPTAPLPAQQPWTTSAVPPPPQGVSGAGSQPSSPDQNDSQVKP